MSSSYSFSLNLLALLSLSLFVSTLPTTDAKKELGLSPRRDANILQHDPLANAPKFVEKPFRFPSLNNVDSVGPNAQDLGQHAGYVSLHGNSTARMFYYLFKSRAINKNVPFILHLTGGPGFSSSLALFYGNGPFKLTDNLSLVRNDNGWDKVANILLVDQPIGTGFSYSTNETDIPTTSEKAAVDLYDFLQTFLQMHPELANNEFYISGGSYAAHYISALASLIHLRNKIKQGIPVKIKGLVISSAWINPERQFDLYPYYAKNMKLINQSQFNKMMKPFWSCHQNVQKACDVAGTYNFTDCARANEDCNDVLWDNIITPMNGRNYYDVRTKCDIHGPDGTLCYDFSKMERFLNQSSVKKALGVDKNIEFVSWSSKVNDAMAGDQMRSFVNNIPELLQDGIKLLVYTGKYDLICNSHGNMAWMSEMKWSGQGGFVWARNVPFKVNGLEAGTRKSFGPLTYVNVNDAGHFVIMDQPKTTLEMISRWMKNIPL